MKTITKLLIITFFLFFLFHCQDVLKDTSATATPAKPTISFRNEYGNAIVYEIWSGTELEYKEGTILGNNLKKEVPSSALAQGLANVTTDTALTIAKGSLLLIVVGVNDGTSDVYINSYATTSLTVDTNYKINSSGFIASY